MKKSILIVFLAFIAGLLEVNAPSIGVGYGFITAVMALAVLLQSPLKASLSLFIGELAAVPFLYYSRSMFIVVAVLGLVLRPIVAYISGIIGKRYGGLPGILALSLLTPLVATTAGILYYGDDGIHSSLSIFDSITALLTWAMVWSFERDRATGSIAAVSLILYILGSLYFYSIIAPLSIISIIVAIITVWKAKYRSLGIGVMIALLIIGGGLGFNALKTNTIIASYPFHPSHYTSDRWNLNPPCNGRSNAMLGVHEPSRLRIVHECVMVEGIVSSIPFTADDGDYCFDLRVEEANATPILSLGNHVLRKGSLHVEIIPMDRIVLNSTGGMICKGDRLRIIGVHVIDTDHGQWAEIHPALNITVIHRGNGPCVKLLEKP